MTPHSLSPLGDNRAVLHRYTWGRCSRCRPRCPLCCGYEGAEHFTLSAGVNNVFDKAYAYHVNRANVDPFNPDAVQVNEPGREYWVRLSTTF